MTGQPSHHSTTEQFLRAINFNTVICNPWNQSDRWARLACIFKNSGKNVVSQNRFEAV